MGFGFRMALASWFRPLSKDMAFNFLCVVTRELITKHFTSSFKLTGKLSWVWMETEHSVFPLRTVTKTEKKQFWLPVNTRCPVKKVIQNKEFCNMFSTHHSNNLLSEGKLLFIYWMAPTNQATFQSLGGLFFRRRWQVIKQTCQVMVSSMKNAKEGDEELMRDVRECYADRESGKSFLIRWHLGRDLIQWSHADNWKTTLQAENQQPQRQQGAWIIEEQREGWCAGRKRAWSLRKYWWLLLTGLSEPDCESGQGLQDSSV